MKKIFKTVAALAVVMFAGCTTDMTNDVVAPVGGQTTVTVGIEDTKTYLGELVDGARKVYWHSSDQIAINGVASTAVELNEEKTAGAFTFDAELTHPYSVLYPAEMYKDATTITLPAVQASATGSFGSDSAPMASYQAAEGTVQMHHLAGVIRLQVTLPAESKHGHHELNKVEFRGKAGEQVSGDFAIDYAALTLTGLSTAEADKVVTAKAFKGLAAGETDDVFIVVPAQEYAEGFTVRLIDDAGHYMDIASKAITIEKGEIKAMPVVEFVPTGTLVGVEIASAEDFIAFANAYNAGDYANAANMLKALGEYQDAAQLLATIHAEKTGVTVETTTTEGVTTSKVAYIFKDGNMIKETITHADGAVTKNYYKYNDINLCTSETRYDVEGGKTLINNFYKDSILIRTTHTNPDKSKDVFEYTCDEQGKILTHVLTLADGTVEEAVYSYDEATGLLASIATANSYQTFAYNQFGDLSNEFLTIDGVDIHKAAYTYNYTYFVG